MHRPQMPRLTTSNIRAYSGTGNSMDSLCPTHNLQAKVSLCLHRGASAYIGMR